MADYLIVPYSAAHDSNSVINYGVKIGVWDSYDTFMLNYRDDSTEVRFGFYTTDGKVYGIFATKVNNYSVRFVSYNTYGTSYALGTSNTNIIENNEWYVSVDITLTPLAVYESTLFTNRNDCITAIIGGSEPEPEPYQGVVVEVIGVPNDPMDEGGTSESRDPTGDFDDESDRIPEPALPTISAQGSGMITLFRPTLEQVHDLGEYLWTHLSDFIENLQKLFTNPMSYIVAFHIVPCVPSVSTERNINIGNFLTSVTMPPCVSQWYTYDFGNITIAPYSGTYLDYSPYTKIQLFLPFIGTVTLNTDEVMGANVGVKYRIDLLSGHFVALISVNNSYIYQYTGECSVPIPLSGNDWSRVYSAAVSAVGTAITGGISAVSGGVGPMQVGMASAASRSLEAAANAGGAFSSIEKVKGAPAMRDRMAQVADLAIENAKAASQKSGLVTRSVKASKVASTVAGTVNAVMGAKQYVSHSGSVTGPAGVLGNKKPFVLIEYPNQSLAQNYKHFVGYPSNISGKVKEFTGYTECEQVVPDSFSGTDEELAQVLELLKEGVYL